MRSTPDIPHKKLISHILDLYKIKSGEILKPQSGYRNAVYPIKISGEYNVCVILYKNEKGIELRIENANRLGSHLAKKGLPARYPLNHRIIKASSNGLERFAGLYNYLPGETIPWEAYTQAHIKLLGGIMGKMHSAMKRVPRQSLPDVAEEYIAIMHHIEAYLRDKGVQEALESKLCIKLAANEPTNFTSLLNEAQKLPNQQPLHMDFVRSNILFSEQDDPIISGILDFEKAAYGHPVFDVARTLAFLLVDCKYKPQDKIRKYFLLSGYVKRGQSLLSNQDLKLIEKLTDMFLLYDFYKFLQHNPYEYLEQNEHFTRTRGLLEARKIVHRC